jgi:hypothetical protein
MSARFLAVVTCGCLAFSAWAAEDTVLPQGEPRAALVAGYFPDRLHEFVWRNWMAIAPAKLAKVVGASEPEIAALAASMGLPEIESVPAAIRERGYITLIRRNWHLLPYEQLLELLDMTPEQLSVMLREEDFLWVKLGRVKPQCVPLKYSPPDEAAQRRAAEIRRVVEQDFGDELGRPAEPRFDFVRQLAEPLPRFVPPLPSADGTAMPRIVYSYVALYGDPLMNPKLNPYPDGLLQRLAASGINGVWLQALLRDLAPGGAAFPEFGTGHETRLANLNELVERAKKFGIDVYLYINEPRAMPLSFFKDRPDLCGVREAELAALCTSQPTVRQWMGDALAHIFGAVPGLAGVYAITASENLTNCASHGGAGACPHCKDRSDTDILTEVVGVIEEGVHRGNPKANVLISDWGWRGHGDAREIIARLPKPVWLMSVSEWSLPIERGGIKSTVGEYSISSVGPGPRALPHWTTAKEAGLKIGAEIQFNNTCEIASIPYLPVMDLVAEHCQRLLVSAHPEAMLIGWTMGGHPSPNLEVVREMYTLPEPTVDKVLDKLAAERFGTEGAPHARKAWTMMSAAFREYPFHISAVYTCPVQCGPANPLYPVKTGYSATMWGIPYDDLNGWRGPYPPEIFAAQFEKIADGWRPGLAELQTAVDKTPEEQRDAVRADVRFARGAAVHFQSVANQTRYVAARDMLAAQETSLSPEERRQLRESMEKAVESEIALARELFTLSRADSRIGFEPSCQYFYLPLDLVEKVINCRWVLGQLEEQRGSN